MGVERAMKAAVIDFPARPRAALPILAAAVIAIAACTSAATSALPASPGGSPVASRGPTASPVTGAVDHPTDPIDVVFRFTEGGGLVPMGFFPTEAPLFSLFGDGTVIFRDGTPAPEGEDGIFRMPVFKTVKLTEDEIQSFLQDAIADGALGVARANYDGPGADLPTAIFTINAGGTSKSVSVTALEMEREAGPDTLILQALANLGARIRAFDREVEGEMTWTPQRWRGVLTPDALAPPSPWPWPDIAPADFIRHPEPDAPGFPVRTMTPAEIELLGFEDIEGGFSDLALTGPDERLYLFALRPLLPDEAF